MSYIHFTSNPEGLYVRGDSDGIVYFCMNGDMSRQMPQKIFDGLMKNCKKSYPFFDTPVEYEGGKIEDVCVLENTDKEVIWSEMSKDESQWVSCKIKISYGDWKLYLWGVTFDKIYNNVIYEHIFNTPKLTFIEKIKNFFGRH